MPRIRSGSTPSPGRITSLSPSWDPAIRVERISTRLHRRPTHSLIGLVIAYGRPRQASGGMRNRTLRMAIEGIQTNIRSNQELLLDNASSREG